MTKITYQTESCSRCGGCGEYSYCQMHGTRCFKCGGNGKQLTRAGSRARKAINEFKTRYYRLVTDLEPGQIIRYNDRWRKVETVGSSESRWLDKATGEWRNYFQIKTANLNIGTFPEQSIEVRYTPEQFRNELLPFARTLRGVNIKED